MIIILFQLKLDFKFCFGEVKANGKSVVGEVWDQNKDRHLTATYHQCYLIFSSLHGSYEKISHSKMGYDVPVL